MATFYGNAVYNGSAWLRLRVDITHSVSPDGASASVSGAMYVESRYSVTDSSNSGGFTWPAGSWGGSTGISHGSAGGATLMLNFGSSFALALGATTDITMSGSIAGVEAVPGTATISATYTLPARAYTAPAAPSGVTATRSSDTAYTIAWANSATGSAPYDTVTVQRSTDGAAWATIATLPGSTTSAMDLSTAGDHAYAWQVYASNGAGTSGAVATGVSYTTPAAPATATATKTATNDILLTWVSGSRLGSGLTWGVQESTDAGTTWTTKVAGLAQAATSWTHAAPSTALPHQYRVRADTTVGGTALASAWALTAAVQLAAAPAAPSSFAPTSTRDPADEIQHTWTHNPLDSSPQRKYEMRRRYTGDTAWITTGTIVASAPACTMLPGTYLPGRTVEWQVRTWGQHADPSPWSATAAFATSTRPITTLAYPHDAGVVGLSYLTLSWAFYDAESAPQSAWQAELLTSAGVLAQSLSSSGTATTTAFSTNLPNGSSWIVRVRASDSAGLWSTWAAGSFTVSYILPPAGVIDSLTWDQDTATIAVAVTVPAVGGSTFGGGAFGGATFGGGGFGGGGVPAVSMDVERSIDGGPWAVVAAAVAVGSTVLDRTPTVAGVNAYRVITRSALPSQATGTTVSLAVPQPGDGAGSLWLSGGPNLATTCRAVTNIAITASTGLVDRVLRRYAGRTAAVEHTGTAVDRTWTVMFDLINPTAAAPGSPLTEWLTLAALPGPFLLRDPDGLYVWVSVSGMAGARAIGGHVTTVTLTAQEIARA